MMFRIAAGVVHDDDGGEFQQFYGSGVVRLPNVSEADVARALQHMLAELRQRGMVSPAPPVSHGE